MVEGRTLSVAQIGNESLILRDADFSCPEESEAEVVLVVDDHVSRYRVILDDGILAGQAEVRYTDIEPASPPQPGMLSDELPPF
jgi:hypothetical protein